MSNAKTPVGLISYPVLFGNGKLNSLNGNNEYSVDILFPKNTDLSVIKAEIDRAIEAKWGSKAPKGLRNPIKDGDGTKQNGEPFAPEYKGHYFVTLKNTRKPGVMSADGVTPITDEGEIYGGCYGRAIFNAFAYDQPANKGVSLSLIHFQKAKDGEPFGASRIAIDYAFDAIDSEEADNPANYEQPVAAASKKRSSILG